VKEDAKKVSKRATNKPGLKSAAVCPKSVVPLLISLAWGNAEFGPKTTGDFRIVNKGLAPFKTI
jgi:hypothetical protein